MVAVLFDIEGTILSSSGAGKTALEAGYLEELGVPHHIAQLVLSGRTDIAITRELLHMHGHEPAPANVARVLEAYLRHLPTVLTNTPSARVLPGIVALLDELERRQILVGLLTGNVRVGARLKLGHFGLAHRFGTTEFIGGFGDLHLDRDDVAREALADVRRHRADLDPQKIWIIGDTPLDIRCARAIGARVVAVATGWHSRAELEAHQPDLLVDDLGDHSSFLEMLEYR
jgi:phosphoglycolate phosphatase